MSERFARIDQAAEWIAPWLATAAGGAVPLRAPLDDDGKPDKAALGCLLAGLAPAPMRQGALGRFFARFLVWASPNDPAAQRRLTGVAFAALAERSWLAVELEPEPTLLALAPGRIGVLIDVPIELTPAPGKERIVTEPLSLRRAPLGELSGVVLADGEHPLPRATVVIPSLDRSTTTDNAGRFRFAGVPADAAADLLVRARGRELAVSAAASPVTIAFPITED